MCRSWKRASALRRKERNVWFDQTLCRCTDIHYYVCDIRPLNVGVRYAELLLYKRNNTVPFELLACFEALNSSPLLGTYPLITIWSNWFPVTPLDCGRHSRRRKDSSNTCTSSIPFFFRSGNAVNVTATISKAF